MSIKIAIMIIKVPKYLKNAAASFYSRYAKGRSQRQAGAASILRSCGQASDQPVSCYSVFCLLT